MVSRNTYDLHLESPTTAKTIILERIFDNLTYSMEHIPYSTQPKSLTFNLKENMA
jgi:hypothetical protein